MEVSAEKHPDSFSSSLQLLLSMAQVCGLLPIKGIFGNEYEFTWRNIVHLYAIFIFIVTSFFDTCYTIDNLNSSLRIDVFASTVFYTACLLTTICFFDIARGFNEIGKEFLQVEQQMKDYGYPKKIGLKIKIFLISFSLLGIVEHGTMACMNVNWALEDAKEGKGSFGFVFYHIHFPAISWRFPYSGLGTITLFWVNIMCTFNWNYLDFFLIVMSMQISNRFTLINSKLNTTQISDNDSVSWGKVSRDFNQLSLLTKKLDKKFSKIILISFFSNFYHLSLQLVRSLKISGTLFQRTYFYFSLCYLIIRLMLVVYFASRINEESKKPSEILMQLENPCPEAIRFLHQTLTDEIALTGNKFFVINKKFFASVIGTLITYQGVLLQFNSLNHHHHHHRW